MNQRFFILFCAALIIAGTKSPAQPADSNYKYITIKYPKTKSPVTSFYINEAHKIFIAINGGIYLPGDSLWFIPPSRDYYFTCFAPNLKDTSLFIIANTPTNSELYYLKSSDKSPIKKCLIAKLEKGIYNLIYKNDVCYVWGYSSGTSKIGILIENGIKWLLDLRGSIKQVQVNDSAEIFFAYKNSIYKLNNRQVVLTLDKSIYGFAIDKENNILISCPEGVGIKNKDKLDIMATGYAGPIEYKNEAIFVLSRSRNEIIRLKSK